MTNPTKYRHTLREARPDSACACVRNHSGERKTQKHKTPPEGEPQAGGSTKFGDLATPNFVESASRVKRKRMFRANGIPLC